MLAAQLNLKVVNAGMSTKKTVVDFIESLFSILQITFCVICFAW